VLSVVVQQCDHARMGHKGTGRLREDRWRVLARHQLTWVFGQRPSNTAPEQDSNLRPTA